MTSNEIKAHCDSSGLYERTVQGLEAIAKSPASVGLDDLAALDEFHLRGPAATRELIEILDVSADFHVLDVGSDLGGPARRLAKETGCRLTRVDLSEDHCAVGNELTGWLGLSERARRRHESQTLRPIFVRCRLDDSCQHECRGQRFSLCQRH